MLSQLEHLSHEIDGRYASDAELEFVADYAQSYGLRLQTYLKLQELEVTLVQQVYTRMRSIDPSLFIYSDKDISHKWKQDTLRVLRYTAIAVLTNDSATLHERFLLWFQTIMRAFATQKACDITYRVLQDVVKQYLTDAQAEIVCPILELNRRALGVTA